MKRVWIMGLAALLLLAGCSGQRVLPQADAEAFAAQVDDMSENVLTALSNQDYAAYVRDMDAQMRAASTEEQFPELYASTIGIIGAYESRQMTQVIEQGNYQAVIYSADFANEEGVTVRVVYDVSGETPLISGLWFDSPLLRQQ